MLPGKATTDNSKTRPATTGRYLPNLSTMTAVPTRCAAKGYLLVEGSDLRIGEILVGIKTLGRMT